MKTFRQYLLEEEKSEINGTYASLKVTEESRDKLYAWLEKRKIENLLPKEDLHCTVVYSRKKINLSKDMADLPIEAKFLGWENFNPEDPEKAILVLKLKSKEIVELFNEAKELGATHDFDEYIPHISVATTNKIPNVKPSFTVEFDKYKIEELDLTKSYSKKDESDPE